MVGLSLLERFIAFMLASNIRMEEELDRSTLQL